MRDRYSSHFKRTGEAIGEIWRDARFVFDANVLINLYRYSDAARGDFLKVLESLKDRVWLPEQAAAEFFGNRLSEISAQGKRYDETKEAFEKLQSSLSQSRSHPFISDEVLKELGDVFSRVDRELGRNKAANLKRLHDDEILEAVAIVFDGRVGEEFKECDAEKIFEEGERRMKGLVPPGYMDYPKHKEPSTEYQRKANYGDFILWKQVLDFAIQSEVPIVFVTDDQKEDWWSIAHGQTVGPRVELLDEFKKVTGRDILIYRPSQFLSYAEEHLEAEVSKETLEEVRRSALKKRQVQARLALEGDLIGGDVERAVGRSRLSVSPTKLLRDISRARTFLKGREVALPDSDLDGRSDVSDVIWKMDQLAARFKHLNFEISKLQREAEELEILGDLLGSEDEENAKMKFFKQRISEKLMQRHELIRKLAKIQEEAYALGAKSEAPSED